LLRGIGPLRPAPGKFVRGRTSPLRPAPGKFVRGRTKFERFTPLPWYTFWYKEGTHVGLMLPYARPLKSGTWRYRRPVPVRLQAIIGKNNLVKTLGKNKREALAAYPMVHAKFEKVLRLAEEALAAQAEPNDLPILTKLELYLEGISRVRRMGFDPYDASVDPLDPESVASDNARTAVADMILGEYPVEPGTGEPVGVAKMDEFVLGALYSGAPPAPEPTLEDAKKLYIAERVTGTEAEIKKKVQRLDRVTGYIEAALGRPPL